MMFSVGIPSGSRVPVSWFTGQGENSDYAA
jgi:hypothetical protein